MNPFRRPGRSERGANRPEGQIIQAGPQTPVSGHPGAFGAGSGQSPPMVPAKIPGITPVPPGISAVSRPAGQPRLGELIKIHYITPYAMTDIVEIERRAVANPLPRAALEKLLARRNVMGILARHYDSIIGYAIYEFHKFYIDLHMLVVDPRDRRAGVGSRLLSELKEKLNAVRCLLRADVLDDNLDGHLFLKANGMKARSVLKDLNGEPSVYRFQITNYEAKRDFQS